MGKESSKISEFLYVTGTSLDPPKPKHSDGPNK